MFMMMMMMRGIACTEDCAVSSPDNDFPILTTADTEGHVPGGWKGVLQSDALIVVSVAVRSHFLQETAPNLTSISY